MRRRPLLPERLEARLTAVDLTDRRASMLATGGANPDLVRKLIDAGRGGKGQRTTNYDWTVAIAVVLQCSVEFLTGESDAVGQPPTGVTLAELPVQRQRARRPRAAGHAATLRSPVSSGPALPVRFVVQAGAWIEVDEQAQERIASPPVAADPNYPRDAQWLELVRGDSADLFYPEGSFVHAVDVEAIGYRPRSDDFVIIERVREQGGLIERSLKQVVLKRRLIELWPRSRNPKWSAPLEFGANGEEDQVRIAALVIGGYLPARRA